MKASFFLLATAAPIVLMVPAKAEVYLSLQQAQALMMKGKALTPASLTLTDEQARAIEAKSDVDVRSRDVRAWRGQDGSVFIVDEVVGKHEFIPFALALDASGAVTDVEVLEYRESYGGGVRDAAWRAQFTGKHDGAALTLGEDIQNISGATLSSKHITDGVKRLLATYSIAIAPATH